MIKAIANFFGRVASAVKALFVGQVSRPQAIVLMGAATVVGGVAGAMFLLAGMPMMLALCIVVGFVGYEIGAAILGTVTGAILHGRVVEEEVVATA